VEALVVATAESVGRSLQFEHARIVEACASPVSVAEVAARVGVPLGVAQILVGDLAEAGLVQVHEARQVATPALLLRMIDAVRAL
jgi:ribosomal protein S25